MIHEIAVIGGGTMGAGIAQLAVMNGATVRLIDVSGDVVDKSIDGIGRRLARLVEKGRLTEAQRAEMASHLIPGHAIEDLRGVELAVEAVVERLDVKHDVFARLERATRAGTVLATNTSSLSVARIAEGVADASRVVGMHFFNPAPLMPLVEVVAHARSLPSAVDAACAVARVWGKTPVRAADMPGFIVNRVARGFYLEALRMLGEGIAGVETIDAVMREVGGFRMGPFQLMDLVGLDVNFAVSTSVWQRMNEHPRFSPHDIQRDLVERGCLGRKTGVGFYDYSGPTPTVSTRVERPAPAIHPKTASAVERFTASADHGRTPEIQADRPAERPTEAGVAPASRPRNHEMEARATRASTDAYVFARILATVINEAALALDDAVASAEDIDTAMRLGTNYPKGPLAWAGEIGRGVVCDVLRALGADSGDGRFSLATGLERATGT